jgi:putative exporter of polyketide antibiotics
VALVTGILGIPCCGCFILGIVAAVTGYLAKKEIAESNGAKTGAGMAQAGFILGIIGIALSVIALALRVTGVIDTTYTTDFGN